MLKTFCRNNLILLLAFLLFLIAIQLHRISVKPAVNVGKQETSYKLNKTFFRLISIGNKRMISNVIWIQTLLESDQEHYKKGDYHNWMFLRFLTIATLDPLFYENYLYGGIYLSVIKDDLRGASRIFDLGLEKFPDDYQLNYYSGFNYFFEMGDYKKGLENLKKIEFHPKAPKPLKMVISKLRFQTTQNYDIAIKFLTETLNLTQDEGIKNKLTRDLYSLVAQRDLECLNSGKSGCMTRDASGRSYFKDKSGQWKSYFNYPPYKIFRPADKEDFKGP